jgi:aspartyl-tRNA(Asn)/glutamyl-tRNA(Gln) amidotransferase subunit A
MLAAFEESVSVLKRLGGVFREVDLPPLQAYCDAKKVIAMAELFSVHAADLRERPEILGGSLRYLIGCGGLITAEEYIQASRWRLELARAMQDVFQEIDLLVLPTMAEPSPRLLTMKRDSFFTGEKSYTTPFNVSGFPALSLCNGFSRAGMPLSLQLAGRPFEEALVLNVAHVYEEATPWRNHRPALCDASVSR